MLSLFSSQKRTAASATMLAVVLANVQFFTQVAFQPVAAEAQQNNQCVIIHASSYQVGPQSSYAQMPSNLPAHVTVRTINLYNQTLQASDLQDAKLFIYGDSHLGAGPYR